MTLHGVRQGPEAKNHFKEEHLMPTKTLLIYYAVSYVLIALAAFAVSQ